MDTTPLNDDPYAQLPDLYDLEHAGFDADFDLYLNLVEITGGPVLELGCGTGRLLLPLAETGLPITGLDQSAPMLDRARQHLEAHDLQDKITLHQGLMTEADQAPGGPFGIVLAPLNGLLQLTTAADQRQTLSAIHRALDPRGQLVLDLLNPTPATLQHFDQALVHEGTWLDANGTRVDKFSSRRLRPAQQLIETQLWYDLNDASGNLTRLPTSFALRWISLAELLLMLELAGFVEWQIYGGYDLEPFDDDSERIIVTAEVSPSNR